MIERKYTLRTITIGATSINQLTGWSLNPAIEKMNFFGSGTVDPTYAALLSEEPIVTASTTAIKTLLTAIDLNNGVKVHSGAQVQLYLQQMDHGGTRKTGSTCLRITIANGLACVTKIAAGASGPAIGDAMVYATSSDGETAPLAWTDNVALPSLAATDQLYSIGPSMLNGVDVGAVETFEYDPKIVVRRNRDPHQPWPTFAYIARRGSEGDGPSIRLTTKHCHRLLASKVAISDETWAGLRAFEEGGFRRPLADEEHIKFTPNAGIAIVENLNAQDGDEADLSIDIAAVQTASLPAVSVETDVGLEAEEE